MLLVHQFTPNHDLAILSKTLWQLKISHRIVRAQGMEQLWIASPHQLDETNNVIEVFLRSPSELSQVLATPKGSSMNWLAMAKSIPVTCFLLLSSVLIAVLTQLGDDYAMLGWFTFTPVLVSGDALYTTSIQTVLDSYEYWRFITPAFIHFSIMHIAFNGIWVWDLGRKIESYVGSTAYFVGFILIAFLSNGLQYYVSQTPLFGGLSGFVYGLVAFAWLMPWIYKGFPVLISRSLAIFFMVWLGIGYTSIPESIGLGNMANTAHLTGLIGGLLVALIYRVTLSTRKRR